MKIRHGHVSNSSSSSFVIIFPEPCAKQTCNYFEALIDRRMESIPEGNQWLLYRDENKLECSTDMDNFDLRSYVTDILGIPEKYITDRTW
jgi:hypothetical protein